MEVIKDKTETKDHLRRKLVSLINKPRDNRHASRVYLGMVRNVSVKLQTRMTTLIVINSISNISRDSTGCCQFPRRIIDSPCR